MSYRNQWRYSLNQPKLWIIDARSFVILMAAGLHLRAWTAAIAVLVVGLLYWVERMKRMSLNSALRQCMTTFVNLIMGRRRVPDRVRRRHFYIDYGQAPDPAPFAAKTVAVLRKGRIIDRNAEPES